MGGRGRRRHPGEETRAGGGRAPRAAPTGERGPAPAGDGWALAGGLRAAGPGAPRRLGWRRAARRAIPERLREIQPGFDSDRPRCPQPANVTKNSRHGGWTGAAAAGRAGPGRRAGGRAGVAGAGRAGAARAGAAGGRGAPGFTCLWNVQSGIGSGLRVAIRSGNCAAPEAGGRGRGIVGVVVRGRARARARAAWTWGSARAGSLGWGEGAGGVDSADPEQAAWTGARGEQAAWFRIRGEERVGFRLPFPPSGRGYLTATRCPFPRGVARPRDRDRSARGRRAQPPGPCFWRLRRGPISFWGARWEKGAGFSLNRV